MKAFSHSHKRNKSIPFNSQSSEKCCRGHHSEMTVEDVAMGFINVANEAMCRPIRALTTGTAPYSVIFSMLSLHKRTGIGLSNLSDRISNWGVCPKTY